MEQRLSIVGLGVADVATATAFYEKLGWSASPASNPSISFFQAGGVVVSLYERGALIEEAGVPDTASRGSPGVTLACNLPSREDVDATLAGAEKAGATITAPAVERHWGGYSGYFTDPDGHAWEIAWNPYLTLDEDGTPRLP